MAIRQELRLWLGDINNNAHTCIDCLFQLTGQLNAAQDGDLVESAGQLDRLCATGPADFMSQSELKVRVFRGLGQTKARLSEIYTRSNKPGLSTTYDLYIEPLMDPTIDDIQQLDLLVLECFGKLCQSWTSVLRACAHVAASRLETDRWERLRMAIETANKRASDTASISPRFAIRAELPLPPSVDSDLPIAEYFGTLQNALSAMLMEIEAVSGATIFADSKAEISTLGHDVFVIMYDTVGSSGEAEPFTIAQQRHVVNSYVIPFANTLGEEDCNPTGDDGNAFLVHNPQNLLPLLDSLYAGLRSGGVCGRISIVSTARRERPLLDKTYDTYSGTCFVLGARVRDHYQKEPWIKDGRSHTFVDEQTMEDILNLGVTASAFRKLTGSPVKLRGDALQRTDIYEYTQNLAAKAS